MVSNIEVVSNWFSCIGIVLKSMLIQYPAIMRIHSADSNIRASTDTTTAARGCKMNGLVQVSSVRSVLLLVLRGRGHAFIQVLRRPRAPLLLAQLQRKQSRLDRFNFLRFSWLPLSINVAGCGWRTFYSLDASYLYYNGGASINNFLRGSSMEVRL